MKRNIEIDLEYAPVIEGPPVSPEQLWKKACSNDEVTINSWRAQWLAQIKQNRDTYGPFKDKSVGVLYRKYIRQPAIIAGSGPSLKWNGLDLKEKGDIPLISCLHNFHFFEDNGIDVDYYVTLDAGDITIGEVAEGGTKTADEYWEISKNKTLVCFIGTHPDLLKKWQGKILFYNAPVAEPSFIKELEDIEIFNMYFSTGGNVLGACMYFAKAVLGCNPVAYVGADFSFSYDSKFHPWNSKYDAKLGYVIKTTDVFGNTVKTWNSYHNFKCFFDHLALRMPGIFINCTEGGTLGAYPEGNIKQIIQMPLKDFIYQWDVSKDIEQHILNPDVRVKDIKILY